MIVEVITGVVVSLLGILFFLSLKYLNSVNKWIIETSKFIYYTGHPLMDDDEKFSVITKRFKHVFLGLSMVILKTIALLAFVVILIATSSIVILLIKGETLPSIHSEELLEILFPAYLYHIPFIVGTLLPILIMPFILKKKPDNTDPYSPIDKLLHYVFLGNANVAKFLFKIELLRNKKELSNPAPIQSVYISGLARAGTTVLMQYLGQINQFSSLSYRNLPFLFLPKTWIKFTSNKKAEEKERFHKDGMMHSIDSFEALEEPFWRNYAGMEYIKEDRIVSADISEDLHQKYNSFRKLVAGDKIYIAKNNNHLLRATSLHQMDEKVGNRIHTIIPFRNPYAQAKSLLNQHKNLSELQESDEFVLDYMNFLVHHEFGLSQKLSVFDNLTGQFDIPHTKNTLEYWLEVWYIFYNRAYSLFTEKQGFHFFCYETFCKEPYNSLLNISKVLQIPEESIKSLEIKKYDLKEPASSELENKYIKLYNKLAVLSINK